MIDGLLDVWCALRRGGAEESVGGAVPAADFVGERLRRNEDVRVDPRV